MIIKSEHLRRAAVKFRKERQAILGFTNPGELFSVTYDFDDKEHEIADALLEEFAVYLTKVMNRERS
jgi:hypothetical protein